MTDTPTLDRLRACSGRLSFARFLGVELKQLTNAIYGLPYPTRYKSFTIPKATGGDRTIHVPHNHLKFVQRALATKLLDCLVEIDVRNDVKRPVSHAFQPKRSIFSNAWQHRGKRFVVNFDLEGFFPSLHFGRVYNFFLKGRDFQLNPTVANLIANLATYRETTGGTFLPQGSPCSPVISNFLARPLDLRLRKLAHSHGCRYSRYADDLTFSTNREEFPSEIAAYQANRGRWIAGAEFEHVVLRSGFRINHAKTRMAIQGTRQIVTGLVVNKQVSVNRDKYKWLRAASDSLFKKGFASRHDPQTVGVHTMARPVNVRQLIGYADHVFHSRRYSNCDLLPFPNMKGPELLLKRLVYYERFFLNAHPLLICEGDTDPVYLKLAIFRHGHLFPNLSVQKDGSLPVRFLQFSKRIAQFTGLQGGSDQLKTFLQNWDSDISMVRQRRASNPVILLLDNDSGANGIMQVLRGKKIIKDDIKMVNHVYASSNLYVVLTPVPDKHSKSCIEDFVDDTAKDFILNGKTFHPGGKVIYKGEPWSEAKHYGKRVLAEKVVGANADKYDFSMFKPILARLDGVISDYAGGIVGGSAITAA